MIIMLKKENILKDKNKPKGSQKQYPLFVLGRGGHFSLHQRNMKVKHDALRIVNYRIKAILTVCDSWRLPSCDLATI